ncbi:hypothetical protein [Sphingomonas lycopersici]|uniref:Uncharacterized protein n=1 Tax=Sphingomonas lycopersici TaxID=2951807 RepID=A0AA41Z6P1_9SPHN|nr:hypothetical protein [Sphingomonas lycopersici]MCW6533918.1 hypothetical protein [Sphingomonas lycopersici]
MTLNAEEQPLKVDVLNGEVVMTGPRVAIALRPSAATETARRLVAAAELAIEQAGGAPVQRLDGDAASND